MNDEKITLDLVIDVQKDFITGALANTQAQANVAHLAETARAHAQAGHWMFFTRDTHRHGGHRAGSVPHCGQTHVRQLYAAQ